MVQMILRAPGWVEWLAKAAALFLFPAIFFLSYAVDQEYEVIGDFDIASQRHTPNGLAIEGTMDKRRACRLVDAVALTSDGQAMSITYNSARIPIGVMRPKGAQQWGPWYLDAIPGEKITLTARYRCHAFWEHSEELTSFVVSRPEILSP